MAIDQNIASRLIIGHLATFIAVAENRSFRRVALGRRSVRPG